MHAFLSQLRHGLQRCDVRNTRVLVAVSGGADSVALLRGLCEVRAEFELQLTVAHLNHGLRGVESDGDADWVGELAAELGLACEIGQLQAAWRSDTGSMEEQARTLRYRFLDEAAVTRDASWISLAHTADDQAETVLHHLLRGTSLVGLRGIPEIRSTPAERQVVRPMLAIRRAVVEQYLQSLGQGFRTDSSNADTKMTRNKIRHVVLPMLREEVNCGVDQALCRLAEQAVDIQDLLEQLVQRLLTRCLMDRQPDSCRIDVTELLTQPRHLVRELFREIWLQQEWPRQAMSFEHWDRLVELLDLRKAISLPNRIEARFHSANLLVLRKL